MRTPVKAFVWVLLAWIAVCSLTLVFPSLMGLRAEYYVHNGVIIPGWERALMGLGGSVKMFRIPIICGATLLALVMFLTRSSFGNRKA